MARRQLPSNDILKGQLINKVIKDHPILEKVWIKKANSYYRQQTDKTILKDLCDDFEEMQKPSHFSRVLSYSVLAHIKLKNILLHDRIE